MSFRVELTKQAERSFESIMKAQPSFGARIAHAIDRISAEPNIGVPLKGILKGLYKYRVGQYRVIYKVHHSHLLIVIIDIGHRKEVYR